MAAILTEDAMPRATAAVDRAGDRDPEDVARDEAFWREIQLGFTLDRSIINLNNGGVSPSPRVVHEAYKRYLDVSNQSPAYHMWQVLEPNREAVRRKLAASAGCDPEELAITRNASEALQIAQLGIDLAPGDEVLTTNQDYGRMLDTWEQRVKRNGIVLKKIAHITWIAAVTASAAAAPCGTIPSQPVSVSYEPVNSSSPPRITKMNTASSTV